VECWKAGRPEGQKARTHYMYQGRAFKLLYYALNYYMDYCTLILYLYVGKDGEKIKKDLLEELPPESYFYIQ